MQSSSSAIIDQSGVVSTHSLLEDQIPVTNTFPLRPKKEYQKNPFVFQSPIDSVTKDTLINMFRFDHLVRSALQLNSWIAIKYHHKYQIYPLLGNDEEEFNTDEDLQKAVKKDADFEVEDQKRLMRYIETVLQITDLETWVYNTWLDAQVGGRGAFFVEKIRKTQKDYIKDVDLYEGTPILFKPLHWKFLDQTYIDTDTFRIKEVRYNDPKMNANFDQRQERPDYLNIDDLVYLTCDDTNAYDNSFGYGNSRLLPIIHLSAARRQATDKDVPEIFTSFWNQTGIIETDDTSDENMAYIEKNLYKAGSIAMVKRQGIRFTPVPLKHDGWFMLQYLGLAREEILRMLRVPDFLLNYDADSRSVIESAIGIWADFVINSDRQQVFDQVHNQFLHKLVHLFLDGNKLDHKIANAIRIKPVFKRISIEDLLSKANSLELLIRRDVITKREARNIIDLSEKRIEDKEADMKLSPLQWSQLSEQEKLLLMQTAAKKQLMMNPPNETNFKVNANVTGQQFVGADGQLLPAGATADSKNQPDALKKEASIKQPRTRSNAKTLASRGVGAGRKA